MLLFLQRFLCRLNQTFQLCCFLVLDTNLGVNFSLVLQGLLSLLWCCLKLRHGSPLRKIRIGLGLRCHLLALSGAHRSSQDDVPAELHKLCPEIICALRPSEIDQGTVQRNNKGYRVHTRMTTFKWKTVDVEDALAKLRCRKRRKAFEAETFKCIMEVWSSAQWRPTIVFVTDFYQLRGVPAEGEAPTREFEDPTWEPLHSTCFAANVLFLLKNKLLRTAKQIHQAHRSRTQSS